MNTTPVKALRWLLGNRLLDHYGKARLDEIHDVRGKMGQRSNLILRLLVNFVLHCDQCLW